jgi:hypothetical protein
MHPLDNRARLMLLACAGAALVFTADCDGGCSCGGDRALVVPTTPVARVNACAQHLPSQTDLAMFFTEMDGVRSSVDVLSTRFSGSLPVDAYRAEVQTLIGVDLLDKTTYAQAGIHPDAGFCVGVYRETPVLLLWVTDSEKFEGHAIASMRKYYRVAEAPTEVAPGRRRVDGPGLDLAWQQLPSGMTALVFGSAGKHKAPRPSVDVLAEIVDVEPDATLGQVEDFTTFRDSVATSWPASIYMNTPRLLSFYKSFDPSLKGYQKEVIDAVGEQIRWTGVGWKADAKAAYGRAFFGVNPETLKKVEGLEETGKRAPRFHRMVGDDAYVFVRTGIDAALFWKEYQALMPARQQKYVSRIFKNLKASTQIDLEKDVIENATGNVGIAIYEVNPLLFSARRATQRMRAVSFLAMIQLRDPARFTGILDRIIVELGGAIRKEVVPGGIVRYGFDPNSSTAPPFAIYMKDDVATLATTTITTETVQALLSGDGPSLHRKVSSDAARTLFEAKKATGLYINMPRVREKVSALGAGLIDKILGPQREIVLQLSLQPAGIAVDGTIALEAEVATP